MKKLGLVMVVLFVVALVTTSVPSAAVADVDKWPEKTIEMIWHSRAGSGGDLYLRALARFMEGKLGQSVIVNNVTGAAGANAWNRVARAQPDGYTLLGVSSTIIASPLQNRIPVNYENFDHVARMFIDAIGFFVRADSPYQTLADLVEDARKRPGEITFGGGTAGNIEFVAAQEFMKNAGCEIAIVPFEGGSDGVVSVLGGHIDAGVGEYAEVAPALESGQIRMLASFNKIEGTDIPSMAEAGFPNINVEKLRGLFVPKGTPQPIIDKLVSLMKEAYDDPDFKAFYTANKLVPAFVTGEAFTELLRKQTEQVKASLEGQK